MKIKIRMTDDSNLLISWEKNKNNIYFMDIVCSYFSRTTIHIILYTYSLFSDSFAPLLVQWQIPPD